MTHSSVNGRTGAVLLDPALDKDGVVAGNNARDMGRAFPRPHEAPNEIYVIQMSMGLLSHCQTVLKSKNMLLCLVWSIVQKVKVCFVIRPI